MSSLSDASSELLETAKSIFRPVLIFFDEVDYITPGSPTAAHWVDEFNVFWRNFRAVYQEALRNDKAMSVVVGGVSSKWFGEGAINGVENAALAFIPEEYLSPLARAATITMIKKISRSAGLIFSEDAANAISVTCSDMPFWVRKACSYIHGRIDIDKRPVEMDLAATSDLLEAFLEQEGTTLALVALRHLFRVYPELESASLGCLEKAPTVTLKHVTLLRKYGVFDSSNPLRASGEMMKRALISHKEQRELGQADVQIPLPLRDNSALGDWAENLALIGMQRNLLEKRLRQLALNFLRADALAAKKRGSTKDRILGSVQPERQAKIRPLTADDAIEQLLWTELTGLITREWPVFSSVFSDRKQFENHAAVVNIRYDAHAKEADWMDFAEYRRSVRWLSDQVSKI